MAKTGAAVVLLALIITTTQPVGLVIDFNVSSLLPFGLVRIDLHEELTCNKLAFEKINHYGLHFNSLEVANNSALIDNLTCEFHFDRVGLLDIQRNNPHIYDNIQSRYGINLLNVTWFCKLISPSQICNGLSECQTDECHCDKNQSDVFYCADGSGCITWDSICNSVTDCSDASDECFCAGFVQIDSSSPVIGGKLCVSENTYCTIKHASYLSELNYSLGTVIPKCDSTSNLHPIVSCLREAFNEFRHVFFGTFGRVSEYCRANCSHVDGWDRFCDHVENGYPYDYEFRCFLKDSSENYKIDILCDGTVDCSNNADEAGCPGRFYCNPNTTLEWVGLDKVCDHVRDCVNGTDECGTCHFEELSSSEFLIQSKVILTVATIMGILVITMNLKVGYDCWITNSSSKVKTIDKILLLQIFFHDALMGIYLCGIVLATIVLKIQDDYCILERNWRASPICSGLGVLFSFSSHGSLLAIASVSITRYLTCHSLVVDIKKRIVNFSSALVILTNLFHSVLPLLPVTKIQDIFRTGIFFSNLDQNPFFSRNPINRSRLIDVYKGMVRQDDEVSIYKMISDLGNVTSKRDIFDVTEISYYGNTGLCVHNIFKSQESYEVYKILYCVALLVLLSIISTAYIKIILKQRRSSNKVAARNAADQGAEGQNSTTAKLTLKVALMIGSQLICWISFILTVLYFQYIAKVSAAPKVFEVFALVVIPINSLLNPIFYSELYRKVAQAVWIKWRQFVHETVQ